MRLAMQPLSQANVANAGAGQAVHRVLPKHAIERRERVVKLSLSHLRPPHQRSGSAVAGRQQKGRIQSLLSRDELGLGDEIPSFFNKSRSTEMIFPEGSGSG